MPKVFCKLDRRQHDLQHAHHARGQLRHWLSTSFAAFVVPSTSFEFGTYIRHGSGKNLFENLDAAAYAMPCCADLKQVTCVPQSPSGQRRHVGSCILRSPGPLHGDCKGLVAARCTFELDASALGRFQRTIPSRRSWALLTSISPTLPRRFPPRAAARHRIDDHDDTNHDGDVDGGGGGGWRLPADVSAATAD